MKKVPLLLFLLTIPLLIFFQTRGITFHDGGYILHSAQRILQGEVIYKDFDFTYTPGVPLLTAIIFKLFGQSVLVERIFAIILSLLTIFILFKLIRRLTTKLSLIITAILVYIAWGPTHINYLSPTMLALTAGLLTNLSFLSENYFFAGIATFLTFLFKQNFGVAIFLNSLIFFFFIKKKKLRITAEYLGGIFSLALLFLVYLRLTNSFGAFISNFYYYTIKKITAEGIINTPFFNGLFKTFFYLTPLAAGLMAVFVLFGKRKKFIFLTTFVILYYLFGIRPITDYIHFVPILSLTGIPLVLLFITIRNKPVKTLIFLFFVVLIVLGFYTALFKGYYRWEAPLITDNFYLTQPKIKIWVDQKHYYLTRELSSYLNEVTKPNEYIFIDSYSPLIYFFTDRRNPTHFEYISPAIMTAENQEKIIEDLMIKNVKWIITTSDYENDNTYLGRFIKLNYQPIKQIREWEILGRIF